MTDTPAPQWALDRVTELTKGAPIRIEVKHVFATYIAQHEQPPIGPDVAAVKDILAVWESSPPSTFDESGPGFCRAVVAYRKHKEIKG